jgi:quercetin dioxygenase-like cupin family protein
MDPYFAEFIPLARTPDPKAHMHPGFEFLYVLDGELELRHGDQECTLDAGDAVYFDAGTPHSYQCAGKRAAKVIIVTMHQPPAFPMRTQVAVATPRGPLIGARSGGPEEKSAGVL